MSECAEIDQPIKVLSAYAHVTRGYIDFVKKKKELFAKNRIQLPVDCFGTPTWPLLLCSGPPRVNYAFNLTKAFLGFCLKSITSLPSKDNKNDERTNFRTFDGIN